MFQYYVNFETEKVSTRSFTSDQPQLTRNALNPSKSRKFQSKSGSVDLDLSQCPSSTVKVLSRPSILEF
ncbi:hypothetical protein MRB53_026561 [Persea americana]|uniref:Uncharacterized protein n=1 Tax=Persea americana TaxID=3435 RepID=A0ACC2LID6_PERAE|nr:hypothetical protein MRB53_026561 [Persea americana]